MKTFRARRGNISSGATFWLIAAIRIKDRIGPGMVAVSVEGGGAGFGEPENSAFGFDAIAATDWAGDARYRPKTAAAKIANVRRGCFIDGYLLRTFEPRTIHTVVWRSRICVERCGSGA
jgi:hypothetical protein